MTAPTPVTGLRKRPTQARAREKFDRTLDAAAEILVKDGIEAINTPHIAEVSGVTVGSIYQYFPNKEAILFELYQRWLDEAMETYVSFSIAHQTKDPTEYFVDLFLAFAEGRTDFEYRLYTELTNALRVNKQLQALDRQHEQRLLEKVRADAHRLGLEEGRRSRKARNHWAFRLDLVLSLLEMIGRTQPEARADYIDHAAGVIRTLSFSTTE